MHFDLMQKFIPPEIRLPASLLVEQHSAISDKSVDVLLSKKPDTL